MMISLCEAKWYLLAVAGCFYLTSVTASPIEEAARFEQWGRVLTLAKSARYATLADATDLIDIAHSCASLACNKRELAEKVGHLPPHARDFVFVWHDIAIGRPDEAWRKLNTLVEHHEFATLGLFGMLEYAISAQNFRMLELALQKATARSNIPQQLNSKIVQAKATVALVSFNYVELESILASEGSALRHDVRMPMLVSLLTWKNKFDEALREIRKYHKSFGLDHIAADAEIELLRQWKPPSVVLRRINSILAIHPRYWRLSLTQMNLLNETGQRGIQTKALASKYAPKQLGEYDLSLISEKVRIEHRERLSVIDDLQTLKVRFSEFPSFHVVVGYAFFRQGKIQTSLEQLNESDRLTPGYQPAALVRILCAIELQEFSVARKLAHALSQLDPNDIFLRIYLAQALILEKNYIEAKAELEFVKRSPRHVPRDLLRNLNRDIEKMSVKRQ